MSADQLAKNDNGAIFENVLANALKIPGIKVNRQTFLREVFQDKHQAAYNRIIELGPVAAGCTQKELDRLAANLITKRTMQSTGISFAAGLPGGLAMAATIPADTMQFFGMALRLAQEIAYLYGGDDLWYNGEIDEEKVQGQLILYCGVMFGVSGSSAAVKVLSSAMAKQVAKKLPQKALTKTIYYPIIKKVAALLGVKMTKDTFAKGVAKAVPVVGGVVSGGLTFASMRPMGKRLASTLSEANFEYTAAEAQRDIEQMYRESCKVAPIEVEFSDVEPARQSMSIQEEHSAVPTAKESLADTLIKYQQLLEAGLLSREEFDLLKQKLLSESMG